MQVTVLGFGKIGRGAAQALRAKVISIVHAEIVLSIGELIELNQASRFGIYENTIETKRLAAELWLSEFVDNRSGRYVEHA